MLDNLRDQASSSSLFHEEEPPPEFQKQPKAPRPHRTFDQRIGITAFQRFLLAFMFFIIVLMLGSALLLVTGKVVPPFLSVP